jgi:glycosyltransferase involved in cell wall biosynthesis
MLDLSKKRKKILIGFLSKTIKGPIPIITNVYVEELKHKYDFIPFYIERTKGKENLAAFNISNLYYFISHYISWCITIIKNRPYIVHYPVTSYWNMEKSLLFLITAKILGVKHTIGHLHGGAFIDFWQSINSFRRFLALKQLKKLDIFIVLSESWRKNIIQYVGIEDVKIKVLHNLIDKEFENHFKDFHKEYKKKDKITILGFNMMDSRKGLFDLLDAVSLLPDKGSFEIVVIGDEREPGVFEKAVKIIHGKKLFNVNIQKGVWGSEKIIWFEKADVLVLPSYIENFPLVVLEAACACIPVIASRLGALPDIFEHNKDILFIEPGNVDQIKICLEYLINNPHERERLGLNIRETFVKKLSGKMIIDQLDSIYQGILSN